MVAISRAGSSIFVKTESLSMLGLQKKIAFGVRRTLKALPQKRTDTIFSSSASSAFSLSSHPWWFVDPQQNQFLNAVSPFNPRKNKKTICSFPSSIWREGSSSTPMAEDLPQNLRALWPLRLFRASGLANLRGHWTDPQSRRSARGWGIRGTLGLQVSWTSWIFMGRTWFQHLRVCQHTSYDGTWPEKCGILSFGNLTWQWKINVCRWFSH